MYNIHVYINYRYYTVSFRYSNCAENFCNVNMFKYIRLVDDLIFKKFVFESIRIIVSLNLINKYVLVVMSECYLLVVPVAFQSSKSAKERAKCCS